MAVLSSDGAVRETNFAFGRICPDLRKIIGQSILEIFRDEERAHVRTILSDLIPGQAVSFYAHPASKSFESSHAIVQIEVSRRADGTIFLVAITNAEHALEWDKRPGGARNMLTEGRLTHEEKERTVTRLLSQVLKLAPVILWANDRNGWASHAEGGGLTRLGFEGGFPTGSLNIFDLFASQPEVAAKIRTTLEGKTAQTIGSFGGISYETWYVPSRDENGEIDGTIGLSVDVTERLKTETELREKLEFIERQNATIRSLATPIIQVWDRVLCLPVIGTVDNERAAEMMQTLLDAIVREEPKFAILDLTGVEIVDTSTADLILRLFRAAKLVGTESVLCGIRPPVAQAITSLGLDLGQVRTVRSLRHALEWCVAHLEVDVI